MVQRCRLFQTLIRLPSFSVSIHMHLAADDGGSDLAFRPTAHDAMQSHFSGLSNCDFCRFCPIRHSVKGRLLLSFFPSQLLPPLFWHLDDARVGHSPSPRSTLEHASGNGNGERALWIRITRPSKIRLNPTRRKWENEECGGMGRE